MPIIRVLFLVLFSSWLVAACSQDPLSYDMPSVVSLKVAQGSSTEADVRHHVQIILDHPQPTDTHIYFNLKGTAKEKHQTRFGIPDYHLLTSSPLVIAAGETSQQITYDILLDSLSENEEHMTIEIIGIGRGNAVLHHIPHKLVYTHYIFEHERYAPQHQGDFIKLGYQTVQTDQKDDPSL